MEISKKVKLGLDEARMEVLGAQVFIGFQLRSAFQNTFEQLPAGSRHLSGLALLLMVCTVGLLIFPGPYHRIVERGTSSGRFHAIIGTVMSCALAPFAIGIALAIGITCERVWGPWGGIFAGTAAGLGALVLWYGLGEVAKTRSGKRERAMSAQNRDKVEDPGLHEKIDAMLTEARVILPGAQALLGFQLAIVLTEAFENLEPAFKAVHGWALLLVCLSILLLMTPTAYHRIVYAGEDSPRFHTVGSWLVTISTVPLALGLAADVFVVGTKIWSSTGWALMAALFSLVFLALAWHVIPFAAKAATQRSLHQVQSTKPV